MLALAAIGAVGGGSALAAPGPPPDAPQITMQQSDWEGKMVSALDRPSCLGRWQDATSQSTSTAPVAFDQFQESKETWSLEIPRNPHNYSSGDVGNDPRFQTENVMVYMHILRDTSIGLNKDAGAVDGTYAVFNGNGLALSQGKIAGVLRNDNAAFDDAFGSAAVNNALFNGLFYDGQVLSPSGATIGRPHLLANFTSMFTTDTAGSDVGERNWYGGYGGTDTSDQYGNNARPAISVGGGCTGNYTPRISVESAATHRFMSRIKPAVVAKELAYMKGLGL